MMVFVYMTILLMVREGHCVLTVGTGRQDNNWRGVAIPALHCYAVTGASVLLHASGTARLSKLQISTRRTRSVE
jgi:hypothetical protein